MPGALVLANEREIERHKQVFAEASAVQRSLAGWGAIRDQGEWLEVCARAEEDYQSGRFLIDRLGAERYLDPQETSTLLHLRKRLIEEMALTTALEFMLVDLAILAYANVLRVQGWIGSLALLIEHDAFRDEGPTMKVNARNGRYSRLNVEDEAARVREQLLPAFDRASKSFLAAIRTLREFRATGVSVNIGQAAQVNVADRQIAVGPSVPPAA